MMDLIVANAAMERKTNANAAVRGARLAFPCLTAIFCLFTTGPKPVAADESGQFFVKAAQKGGYSISVGERELFRLLSVEVERFEPDVSMQFGFFKFKKKGRKGADLDLEAAGDGRLQVLMKGNEVGLLNLLQASGGAVRGVLDMNKDAGFASMRLKFACGEEDRFWGFGEQYNAVDFRGETMPVWVQEQGVGRKKKPVLPYEGKLTDSYFPMPWFLDPARGVGFLLENAEYSEFDLCAGERDAWSVEVWNGERAAFSIYPGPTAMDVVARLTAEAGRPEQAPPDWTFSGVWLAAQGGAAPVRERVEKALAAGVPVSAVWAQDWVGQRHFGAGNYGVKYRWIWDEELYPDLPGMIADFKKQGVRFLGYFNPFVVPDYEHFAEAAKNGWLVKNADGEPYVFQIVTFKGGLVDVFNPEAREWFKSYAKKAAEMGISGWMSDFGEWLPFDASVHNGAAPSVHNLYATEWHRLSREALEEAYPDGDYALFTRSGYTGEQGVAQFVWAGDQEADWTETDGLPTVLAAGLTAGMSGVPFFTHDIAGFSGGPSTKELFMRWTELGAFTPVMRTHDGLQKKKNWRFDSDEDTLAHFKKFALIHRALAPYFEELAEEAVETGAPIIRHTAFVDPEWGPAYDAGRQWMIGNDLLIAPVVKESAKEVEVCLPEGEWIGLSDGETYSGRQKLTAAAPIGRPAVFMRKGAREGLAEGMKRILNVIE